MPDFPPFTNHDERTGWDLSADRIDGGIRIRATRSFFGFTQDVPEAVARRLYEWLGKVLEK